MDLQSELNVLSQFLTKYEKEEKAEQRKRKKLRKVAIDSEGILSFMEDLAANISECLFQEVPDRTDMVKEGWPKLASTSALLGIATGLVLTNYQEGIAADAVKRMNGEDLDSAWGAPVFNTTYNERLPAFSHGCMACSSLCLS